MSTVQSRISTFESLGGRASAPARAPSPSPSPPQLGRSTSLLDLRDSDWIVDDGPGARTPTAPLISFEAKSKTRPPIKPKPASLAVPGGGKQTAHGPSSSISSFHSVSLSSDTAPAEDDTTDDSLDWVLPRQPPKLPQRPRPSRPVSPVLSPASSSSSLPYTPRRPAPPPPQPLPPPLPSRSSDRSSIRSIATTNSSLAAKTKRPTPVPLAARRRYEAVFTANVIQRRRAQKRSSTEKPALLSPGEARGRRALGWRGLSIDLITGDELPEPVDESVGPDDVLEAAIVRCIWKKSRLSNAQLADIWNECDIAGKGALNIDAFVKGMWRIDEELRRAQTHAIKSATNGAATYRSNSLRSTSSAHRQHHSHRPRDILR
ncbi:Increased rDNA silencing protein 4 [Psilocybe cubensis]|uniref:Increased rDNA silencing protein 4 n=2 Tax=Psilocybe cubensis TaxID=181762 RepID=A0ACB8H8E3_PSICU|nr:Increased rDNA silencing protein 4 [Psilocybe cubensis]KAH9483932.1 Increased rDNA silencing protein 4 [Psilocybe cubensis]